MGIPDSVVEEVRRRADLVELVSRHTRLRRSGKTFRGPCPLHGGEGPNFSVDPGKQIFKCFVCGEAGDLFSFPMKHLGMSFTEAVRHLAAEVGVDVPEASEQRPEDDPLAHLRSANAYAAEWFRKRLWEGEEGAGARVYLERRGISRPAAERFGLGWAPEAWTELGDAARKQGIADDVLMALGLVKESTRGGREPYDAFRGRLIFPIEDPGGRVIAFGGRIIGEAEPHVPKYLNSPESPLYHKGDTLYGLSWSRGAIRREEAALVVEGYMDYVSLAAHGVENVVAPLGTALTSRQGELLARYAHRVILLYDSDRAGLKATFRSGDELLRAGVEVLVATLPEGEDPDSIVRGRGPEALRKYVHDAIDVLDRKISILDRRGYFSSLAGRRRAIDALLPTVRACADEVLREMYLTRVAEKTGVPRDVVEREAAESPRGGEPAAGGERRRSGVPDRRSPQTSLPLGTPPPGRGGRMGPERNLLLLLLRDERWVEESAKELSPDDFRDPANRVVYEGILHAPVRDPGGAWLEAFPAEVLPLVEELLGDPEAEHLASAGSFFTETMQRLLSRPFVERLQAIQREIADAAPEVQERLLKEQSEIRATMRERKLPLSPRSLRSGAP
jgi:DNA primase